MLEAGKRREGDDLWKTLDPEFIRRGHRVRSMRRAAGLVMILTVISTVTTANTTHGLSGLAETLSTLVVGTGLALLLWRHALTTARRLALMVQTELDEAYPDDANDIGDIRHPSVMFAPWIPNSRRRIRDVLMPFAKRRKR